MYDTNRTLYFLSCCCAVNSAKGERERRKIVAMVHENQNIQ